MLRKAFAVIVILAGLIHLLLFAISRSVVNFLLAGFSIGVGTLLFKGAKPKKTGTTSKSDTVDKVPAQPPRKKNTVEFNVAGVTKKNDAGQNIQHLLSELVKQELETVEAYQGLTNKEILEDYYDERMYEVSEKVSGYDDVYFAPEPTNPYDPNAIRVFHKRLGHIGYVPREANAKVGRLIDEAEYSVFWELVGGKFKYVDEEDDKVKVENHNYGIKIEITY